MEEKKKNYNLIVVLIMIIILLIGAVGYFCYDKYMKNDISDSKDNVVDKIGNDNVEENNKIEDNVIEKELANDLIKKYIDYAMSVFHYSLTKNNECSSDDFYNKDMIKASDFNDEDFSYAAFYILADIENENYGYDYNVENKNRQFIKRYLKDAISDMNENEKESFIFNGLKRVDANHVEDKFNDIFYKSNYKVKRDYNFTCPSYYYNQETNYFLYHPYFDGCGGTCGPHDEIFELKDSIKYMIKDDEVYVYVNVVYTFVKEVDGEYYHDIYGDKDKKTFIKTINEPFDGNLKDYSNTSQFKYTFKKNDNGTYHFVQLEKVK